MEIVQDKWKEILQRVRDEHELSEISFTTWIEPLTIHSVEDNLITILVPSEKMGLDYVSKKYTLPIKVAIAEITGVNYEIDGIADCDSRTVPGNSGVPYA